MQIRRPESFSPQYLKSDKAGRKGQQTTLPVAPAPPVTMQIAGFKKLLQTTEVWRSESRASQEGLLLAEGSAPGSHTAESCSQLSAGCGWAAHTDLSQLLQKQWWCHHCDERGAERETNELKLTSAHGSWANKVKSTDNSQAAFVY